MSQEHEHQGLHTTEAAGAAGIIGHEFREHGHEEHHYGRDAAIGAGVLEHEHHKHENKHDAHDHPTVGDKIKGAFEKVVGKATGDEKKVVSGDMLVHGNTLI